MLPVIAIGVGVSIPVAGLLVSAYALGVMVGAPIMTVALSRLTKKAALIALMGIFVVGNVLSALAVNYAVLMAARVVTSFAHGAYFGIGVVFAAGLVAERKRGSAIATVVMGLTIANIGGVPAAAWVGHAIGWRTAFGGIAGLGVVALVALRYLLPDGEAGRPIDLGLEFAVLRRPVVLATLATTVLGSAAMFTFFTYVTPILQTLSHASPLVVTGDLVLVGIGFTVGNDLGGRFSARSVDGTLLGFLAAAAVVMLIFPFAARTVPGAAIMLFLWGIVTFGFVPPTQLRVMDAASEAEGLASSINIGAFNLGNAVGAGVGGLVLTLGLGYADVPLAGAAIAAAGVGLVLVAMRGKRLATVSQPAS
jgi:DHA1 family inner membrane transport protein